MDDVPSVSKMDKLARFMRITGAMLDQVSGALRQGLPSDGLDRAAREAVDAHLESSRAMFDAELFDVYLRILTEEELDYLLLFHEDPRWAVIAEKMKGVESELGSLIRVHHAGFQDWWRRYLASRS